MSHENAINNLRGIFPAIFTPFDQHNQIDLAALSRIAEFQLASGAAGFFVTGSTGESLLLNYEERLEVIEHMVDGFGERATIIAHVGHPSTDFAKELARDSAQAGADWIASVGPIYYGTTFEGTLHHYSEIAAASDKPFMIYAFNVDVKPERDARLFEIPNVCGLKYTGCNFCSVHQLARHIDRPIAMLSGFDEQFVAAQLFGFQGGIGSTYNFAPRSYSEMFRLCQDGNFVEAQRHQSEINKVTALMVEYDNWTYRKAIMRYIGLDIGACRAPYAPITDQEYEAFAIKLDQLGVLKRDEALQLI